ncbi:MAG: lipid-A-disaccharide synthase, partial [Pseudomonadota bacterium]
MTETLPAQPLRLMLVAAEPSADKLGAALMAALKAMAPGGVVFCGCGGPAMAAEGFESLFPIDRLAVMGLKDVLPVIPEALKRVKELAVYAQAQKVDAAILIDSWGIGYRVAKHMKQLAPDIPCIKYVAPQVWASRPQRVQKVKTYFDCVLTVLPFEPPWFERAGVPAYYVGNPNFEAAAKPGDGAAFRHRHGIGAAPLLAVLPGSRTNEIRFLLEPFGETVRRVCVDMPDLRIVVPAAPAVADAVKAAAADWPGAPVVVEGEDARRDAFAAADGALAASGTVTTELGLAATPMIVAYKVGWMTGVWAR